MPITVLSPEESATERRRVKANEGGGGDGEGDAWKFLSHSKNSLDLGEIVNSVEYQGAMSDDAESRCRGIDRIPFLLFPKICPLELGDSPFPIIGPLG